MKNLSIILLVTFISLKCHAQMNPGGFSDAKAMSAIERNVLDSLKTLQLKVNSDIAMTKVDTSSGTVNFQFGAATFDLSSSLAYIYRKYDNVITVAESASDSTADYSTITAALAAASAGDVIVIYPSNYDESITLVDSVDLKFLPKASLNYTTANTTTTIICGAGVECNIYGGEIYREGSTGAPVLSMTGGKLNFYDSQIGRRINIAGSDQSIIQSGGELRLYDTDIAVKSNVNSLGDTNIFISNGSEFYFDGDTLGAYFAKYSDTCKININVKNNYTRHIATDTANVFLNIVEHAGSYSKSTGLVQYNNKYADIVLTMDSYSEVEITGNYSGYHSKSAYSKLDLHDVYSPTGFSRIETRDSTEGVLNINNFHSYMDIDDAVTGSHNLEFFEKGTVNISNSHIEFSGYSGDYNTMGNPLVMADEVVLKSNNVNYIDNTNDNVTGANYSSCIFIKGIGTYLKGGSVKNINNDNLATNNAITISRSSLDNKYNVEIIDVYINNQDSSSVGKGDGIGFPTSYPPGEYNGDTIVISNIYFNVKDVEMTLSDVELNKAQYDSMFINSNITHISNLKIYDEFELMQSGTVQDNFTVTDTLKYKAGKAVNSTWIQDYFEFPFNYRSASVATGDSIKIKVTHNNMASYTETAFMPLMVSCVRTANPANYSAVEVVFVKNYSASADNKDISVKQTYYTNTTVAPVHVIPTVGFYGTSNGTETSFWIKNNNSFAAYFYLVSQSPTLNISTLEFE